ncbi:MAG: DMT family transporter [Nanoarchaeota archaeon]|nr:DMT family transporter [Nanoarchaeota archaeon]
MNWFILAILAAVFFSAQRIVARLLLRKQGNPIAFTVCHNLIAGAVIIPAFFFFDFHLPVHAKTWLLYLVAVFFYGVGDVYTYKAIQNLSVSTWQIITQVRHIFTLLGGFLIYSEPLAAVKILGIVLIITGAFVTLYNKREKTKLNWSVGIFFTVLAAFLISAGIITDKTIIHDFSMPVYVSLNLITISVGGFLYLGIKGKTKSIVQELKMQRYGLLLAGILFGIHKFILILAIKLGEVSRVIPVSQAALIFTVIAGVLFLKENERLPQKVIGIAIIALGVISMYFF